MKNIENPRQNQLLATRPFREFESISPHLERVKLTLVTVLYDSGNELRYAYFHTTSIVSKHYLIEDGASTEIAVVTNDFFKEAPL
ncbi:MAG: hypothetical protein ABSB19_18465 [Methylomonas sp.]|jgi:N-acetyl-anhydromuramyl-L-alanine amidase AmpD